MIGFRDMTFCMSKGCKNACGRQLTPDLEKQAIQWWGGEDYPLAMSIFCTDEGELIDKRNS